MQLKLARTLWGIEGSGEPQNWDAIFGRIKASGFDGVETSAAKTWAKDETAFGRALEKHGLELVGHLKTDDWSDATTISIDVDTHIASFRRLARGCRQMGAVLINSHSGHDSWTLDEAERFFAAALEVERELGVPIVHETHRQRQLHSPYQARDLFRRPGLAGLRINADLSHWCVVCEHVFDEASPRDAPWWPPLLAEVAQRARLIHARVGYEEGPQVNDWRAPEHAAALEAHLSWWAAIWRAQAARGDAVSWVEPEFGPAPYAQCLPYTEQPVADIETLNTAMAARLRERFAAVMAERGAKRKR